MDRALLAGLRPYRRRDADVRPQRPSGSRYRPDALDPGSAWFSSEQNQKGQIKVGGQLADLAVLSKDYFRVPEEEIKGIESVLTVVNGDIVYAAGTFGPLAPPAIPVLPDWSPVVKVPGHYRSAPPPQAHAWA